MEVEPFHTALMANASPLGTHYFFAAPDRLDRHRQFVCTLVSQSGTLCLLFI